MSAETILREATFNPKVKTYVTLNGLWILLVTVVGIPFLPVWAIVGPMVAQRQLDRMSCVLTDRSLKMKKGIFVRVEKTIPLDKVTDLGVVQGPLMRMLDIEALSVETAGQSSAGPLLSLVGIENGPAFRDAVLAQRDKVTDHQGPRSRSESEPSDAAVLTEILDALLRIEKKLEK